MAPEKNKINRCLVDSHIWQRIKSSYLRSRKCNVWAFLLEKQLKQFVD